MVHELFPPDWYNAELLPLVLSFIRHLPVDPEEKKRSFQIWAEESGVEVTGEMIERITGLPASEV